jgi:hypothetical protein
MPFGPLSDKVGRHPPFRVRTISRAIDGGKLRRDFTVERIDGGKLRCTGASWDDALVIMSG